MCNPSTRDISNKPHHIMDSGFLDGKLLIAMPLMQDKRFARSVIYICAHSEKGAMGLIINQTHKKFSFLDLLTRLDLYPGELQENEETIELGPDVESIPVHIGGPVETGRGFVLHSSDYFINDTTLTIDDDICLTATIDILKAMAEGKGPQHAIMALGYSGWEAGQLESEIQANGWLSYDANPNLIFSSPTDQIYNMALDMMGISADRLVGDAGHA